MELEALLERRGCTVLGPVPTVGQALALLDGEPPDVALLDVNLKGERATPVAAALIDRGVPFVLITGYSASAAERAGAARRPAHRQAGQLPRARPRRRPGAGGRDTLLSAPLGAGCRMSTTRPRPRRSSLPRPPTARHCHSPRRSLPRPDRASLPRPPAARHCRAASRSHPDEAPRAVGIASAAKQARDLLGPLSLGAMLTPEYRICDIDRDRDSSGRHEPCRRRQEVVWSPRGCSGGVRNVSPSSSSPISR